jgi:ABC-2 type transport system permease protein
VAEPQRDGLHRILDLLPSLLWSTAAAVVVLGALLHRWLYARGFTKAQESGERWAREAGRVARRMGARPRRRAPRAVLKEIRVFFRDTTQWSQLILLGVLVVVYVFNIKFLPLTGEGITFFIVNLVPFLNLALAGFVLASVAARFIFRRQPGGQNVVAAQSESVVGSRAALVEVLGGDIATPRACARDRRRNEQSPSREPVHVRGVGIHDHAHDIRARGPRNRLRHRVPAFRDGERSTDSHVVRWTAVHDERVGVIGSVIVLEARPVYSYLSAVSFGGGEGPPLVELIVGFGLAAAVCLTATFWPIRVAQSRLEALER